MGAFGKTAVERVLFGSNTLAAMRHLSWPLIIVPPGSRFKQIKRIGLACDLIDVTNSVHADKIVNLVKEFNAQLHVLHVTPAKHGLETEQTMDGSEWLSENAERR